MKLAIIMLPESRMPFVRGGYARLCDSFIKENEAAENPLSVTVIARASSVADKVPALVHTVFAFVDVPEQEPLFSRLSNKKIAGKSPRGDYLQKVRNLLRDAEYDAILLFGGFETVGYYDGKLRDGGKIPLYLLTRSASFVGKGSEKYYAKLTRVIFTAGNLRHEAIAGGLPSSKTALLAECVNVKDFSVDAVKRSRIGADDDTMVAVFVGSLRPERGIYELVKAFGELPLTQCRMRLVVVGKCEDDEFMKMIQEEATRRVIFTGEISPEMTAAYMAAADFAVVPDIGDDSAGLSVLEAMASGLPLVISDSEALSAYAGGLIQRGGCITVKRGLGYVEALSEAVAGMAERIYTDAEWRTEIAVAAKECASVFSCAEFYRRLCGIIG